MFSRVYEAGSKCFDPASFYHITLDIFLCLQFLGYSEKFVVPLLSKTADEWLLEKLIDGNMKFLSQHTCAMANIPAMVLHPDHIAYMIQANGI